MEGQNYNNNTSTISRHANEDVFLDSRYSTNMHAGKFGVPYGSQKMTELANYIPAPIKQASVAFVPQKQQQFMGQVRTPNAEFANLAPIELQRQKILVDAQPGNSANRFLTPSNNARLASGVNRANSQGNGGQNHHFHGTYHAQHDADNTTPGPHSGRRGNFAPVVSCQYRDRGCKYTKKVWSHTNECEYRPVPCPDLMCKEYVEFNGLLHHIERSHSGTLWLGEVARDTDIVLNWSIKSNCNFNDSSSTYTWILAMWHYDGNYFFANLTRIHTHWYTWVYILGHLLMADLYKYTIRLINQQRKATISYQGYVHPIDENADTIISSHDCLVAPDEIVQMCLTQEGVTGEVQVREGYDYKLPIEYALTKCT